jgi:two-component system cell cycle sensor histidine kinase/response regulator CckA
VDDDPLVLDVVSRALRGRGYAILQAQSTAEALGLLERDAAEVALVITDVHMPGASGISLGKEVLERWPSLPVLLMSAFPGHEVVLTGLPEELPLLAKPFAMADLYTHVERLIRRSSAS